MNEVEKITNFEKIKAMNIDEMAEWLVYLQKFTSDTLLFELGMLEHPKTTDLPELTLKSAIKNNKQWLEEESNNDLENNRLQRQ